MITISLIIGGIAVALTRYVGRNGNPSNEDETGATDSEGPGEHTGSDVEDS